MQLKNLRLYLIIIFILSTRSLFAQQSTRLDTGWQFIRQDLGGIWEAIRPEDKGIPHDVPHWQQVTLPHCFNARDAVDPDMNYYQGPGWYRTQLGINNPYKGGRVLLHFEGAGQKTDVYVYDTKVGAHLGGYDEWTVDITKAVDVFKKTEVCQTQFKGNVPVEIRCDNSRDLESIPSRLSDFTVYGGLYRYLNLVYVPAVSLEKVFARAEVDKDGRQGKLNVAVRVYDPEKINAVEGDVKVIDPQGKVIQQSKYNLSSTAAETPVGSFTVKTPQLWSPDHPVLYTIEVSARANGSTFTQRERIGFRNFEFVDHGPFMLNGKRLLLRGTHRHEDEAGVAAAMTEGMIRQEMQLMKDMGVNFIRLGHYQQSRIVLNLCDSLGILAWEEEPWCRGGLGGDIYKNQARQMLTNMIEQHYNHPAIILWGLGNENDWEGDFPEFDKAKIRAFMSEQNDLAHRLDPFRKTTIRRCDFCKDIVDVYSPSIWAGWYRGTYNEYKQTTLDEFNKVTHFFHAEWGGDSHALRHSEDPDKAFVNIKTGGGADERAGDASLSGGDARVSKDGDWSESYICNLFDWHLKEQETMPWLTGSAFWVFKDFSTPLRPDNPIPYMNQKGVVERDMTKKESYYVFQSYWTTKPMAHIYGRTWPVRWGTDGEQKVIKVYSNCEKAELFLNGKSYGVKKRNSQDFPAAGLRWVVTFKKGNNNIRVVAHKGKTTVTDEINQVYQTDKWDKPAKLIVEKIADKNGFATVQVKVLDKNGIQCLDAINWISFSLSGDGILLDDLGTSGGSRKVQAYNGRATIKVQTQNGKSVVGVQSPGLQTVFINL
ncbi:glycoside hydrolase family 2 TIM barrel-domain containing protein [Mucilaginibacter gossypii]|uniref:glycoside hydrolase family 2 protein n=1 Tax=Mucilaginibacter gossypii TaxID=551996 RepID=UPI000DCCE6D8|nr:MULTISPECIES: glycoside hydrolase family 2 TIM barrel-domain containing protein [Mucilaginibacter]QTE38641.1 glycoside hydrolase family 2 TIM barrel-domain containing protein [Mucilaginibacter gossypii]RAV55285.1 glycoside hydrolase family 2 [Mucilaginibacter rubeus]